MQKKEFERLLREFGLKDEAFFELLWDWVSDDNQRSNYDVEKLQSEIVHLREMENCFGATRTLAYLSDKPFQFYPKSFPFCQ